MKRPLLFTMLLLVAAAASAQQVSIPEMNLMLNRDYFSVDTLLKRKGYRLMEKEIDSAGAMYYYSHLQQQSGGPAWVRSLSYAEARRGELMGKMINYRTYNRDEYQQLMAYLLANGFKTQKSFEIEKAHHTLFSNGTQSVTVKLKNNRMPTGKWIRSYEIELGK